jgi:hypothetical protein
MMKLWLENEGWDELEGALVRAENETQARTMVAEKHGDEGYDIWLEPSTRCIEVEAKGEAEILLTDFCNG